MVRVKIDGQEELQDIGSTNTMADLVELVKAHIDPDSIITSLKLEGRELADADWRVPLSVQGDALLEVTTGSKEEYVSDRLNQAQEYLEQILGEIAASVVAYRQGSDEEANNTFSQAMGDLKAFFTWFGAVLEVLSETAHEDVQIYSDKISPVLQICEEIVQHQLHQDWSRMADSIEGRLVPELRSIQDFCRTLAAKYTA